MGLINFILDLAGLLLWLGWRDMVTGSLLQNPTTPLARTLRRAGPSEFTRWKYLGGLGGLLLLRTVIYWWVGPAVNWTPKLGLAAIVIPFRSEFFGRMILFSLCSFAATLGVFYLSLLLLSIVNRSVPDGEPLQKFVRTHLGRWDGLPFVVKLLLPVVTAILLRLAAGPLWNYWELIPTASSVGVAVRQGLFLGLGACLVWKYVIAGLLLLHFLNSYVYFGNQPLWNYANLTSRKLLTPLRWLPLKFGRIDFTPVVGIVVVFLLAELFQSWLVRFYPS